MKQTFRLTASQTARAINLENMRAAALFIANPTGSPVVVRVGANDVPSLNSADHRVPANGFLLVPVDGTAFGAGFTDTTAISSPATSNLQTIATLIFLDDEEPLPSFGSASFQSLSLSDLTSGLVAFSGPVTSSVFDLGSWGGGLVYLAPDVASGQGFVIVEAASSAAPASWSPVGTWAFWPGVPSIIQIPRTLRFMRVRLVATTIAGEAAISGGYSVRGTIAEILSIGYTPFTNAFTKAFNVSAGTDGTFYLATAGLPSITVGVSWTTGTRTNVIAYAAASTAGPWRTIAFRDQSTTGLTYGSLVRTYGSLDQYTEIVLDELAGVNTTGTLTFTIPGVVETNDILQLIYAALGDTGQAVNTRQSIYHELEAIYSIALASIDSRLVTTNATLSTISTTLSTISTQLGTINTSIGTVNTSVQSVHTDLSTTIHNDLNTTIHGDLLVLTASQSRGDTPQSIGGVANGAFTNFGAWLVPGWYITSLYLSAFWNVGIAIQGSQISIATGTGVAAIQQIMSIYMPITGIAGSSYGLAPNWDLSSIRTAGFQIPAGHTNLWVMSNTAPMNVLVNIIQTP